MRSGYLTPALWGARGARNCYVTRAFSVVHNARNGDKIRSGYLTLAFSGAKKRAALIHDPCVPGVPYAKHENITSGSLNPAFSGAHDRAELLHNPCILGGSERQEQGQNQKWLPYPCVLGGLGEAGFAA